MKSTYVDALPNQIDKDTKKSTYQFLTNYCCYRKIGFSKPNLQNIPIRTLRGQQIRGAFVADEGNKLISADYSQIELRLIAEISGEENMIKAFQNGEDIHASTAAKLFKIPIEEVTKRSVHKPKPLILELFMVKVLLLWQSKLDFHERKQNNSSILTTKPIRN